MIVVLDKSQKVKSHNVTRCCEIKKICYLFSSEKYKILKSYHRSTEVLLFTPEELEEMTTVPSPNKDDATVCKLFDFPLVLLQILLCSDMLYFSLPPPSGEAIIHKLNRKCS